MRLTTTVTVVILQVEQDVVPICGRKKEGDEPEKEGRQNLEE